VIEKRTRRDNNEKRQGKKRIKFEEEKLGRKETKNRN
jgi:hypothetical protein